MGLSKVVTRLCLETVDGVTLLDKQHENLCSVQSQPLPSLAMNLLQMTAKLSLDRNLSFKLGLDKLADLTSQQDFNLTTVSSPMSILIDSDLQNQVELSGEYGGTKVNAGHLHVAGKTNALQLNVPTVSVTSVSPDHNRLQVHIMYLPEASISTDKLQLYVQSYVHNSKSVRLNARKILRKHVPVGDLHVTKGSTHFDTRQMVKKHHRGLMRDLCLCVDGDDTLVHITPHSIQCSTQIKSKSENYEFQSVYLKL